MATPPLAPEEIKRREEVINDCLREGYAPLGQSGGVGSAIEEAMRRMGLPGASTTIRYIRTGKIKPDWSVYKARATTPFPPIDIPQEPVVIPAKPRVRVQAGKPGGTRYKVLAIGDAHDHPDISKERFRWIGKHAAAIGADYVVSIGDFGTFDSLNSHISNESLLGKSKSPFYRDMESGKEALGELVRGFGSHNPKRHVTLGNHERRAWTHEDNHPEVQNLLTGPLLCLFEDHGFTHTEYGAWWFLGGVGFTHAPLNKMGKTIGGETRNTILHRMVFDVVRGHDHQEYTQPLSKFGPIGHVTLVGLGCALPHGHIESYAMHALNGWSFGVKELIIQDGRITDASWVSMLELSRRYS